MADSSTESRPYAIAAFKQAREEGQVDQWSQMLALLEQLVSDATMKGLIANPRVNNEQLVGLIADIADDAMSGTGANFVRLLAEYGRLNGVADIREIFEKQRATLEGMSHVQVTSAYEMDDSQQSSLQSAISKRLGTDVDLTVDVDSSLIGGVVIRAGDMVIDASLRGRLTQLGNTLL